MSLPPRPPRGDTPRRLGAGGSYARPWALFLALALLAGCRTSEEVQIASSASAYEWHHERYVAACVSVVGPADCTEREALLVRWRASLVSAADALKRWGRADEQIAALKSCRKEAGRWAR